MVSEQSEDERAASLSEVFLGGENRAVLREQDSAGPAKNPVEFLVNERKKREIHLILMLQGQTPKNKSDLGFLGSVPVDSIFLFALS